MSKTDDDKKEWVIVVPSKLTQYTFRLLRRIKPDCIARPWHFESRHGSRTRKYSATQMAIPIISNEAVTLAATRDDDLRNLLNTDDVEIVCTAYVQSHRILSPPPFDATVHPERKNPNPSSATSLPNQPPPSFTFIELFAGIGGFGIALQELGGRCVFSSEIDQACVEVYKANVRCSTLHGDITTACQQDKSGLPKAVDLLVGGFPCQPFSAMGVQPGLDCEKNGALFKQIVRILNLCQPRAFLLENVQGLYQMKDTFKSIISAFKSAGYDVTAEVIDARCLTATKRKRLYFVGTRRCEESCADSRSKVKAFEFPYIPDLGLRARDVVEYGTFADDDMERLFRINNEQLDKLNSSKYWRPSHLAWPDTVCNTLVSHYGRCVARGDSQLVPAYASATALVLSTGKDSTCDSTTMCSSNPRRFTPRECCRIMGFPNSFVLSTDPRYPEQGAMTRTKELYRMIGNAVCPPVIAAIAGAVLDHAFSSSKESNSEICTDWANFGRETAVRMAREATLTGAALPSP